VLKPTTEIQLTSGDTWSGALNAKGSTEICWVWFDKHLIKREAGGWFKNTTSFIKNLVFSIAVLVIIYGHPDQRK